MKAEKRSERNNNRLTDKAYRHIERLIASGELAPNDRLLEEDLSEMLHASRTPVREALQKLARNGVIRRDAKKHFVVRRITEDEVDEAFDLRSMLEGYACVQAAANIRSAQIKALEEIVKKERDCLGRMDVDEFIRLDEQFHDAILKAAGSRYLMDLASELSGALFRFRYIILRFYPRPAVAVEDHDKILSLLRERKEKEIRRVIENHLERGRKFLKKKIRESQAPRI